MSLTGTQWAQKFASSATDQCLGWPLAKNVFGYGILHHKGKARLANRVVCELAHGAPENDKLEAAHSCGNRACVNPRHLRWATHAENQNDKIGHGTSRTVWGESHGRAKLTEADVRVVLGRLDAGESLKEIASSFGVTVQNIASIRNGKTWAHVSRAKASSKFETTYRIGAPVKGGAVIVTLSEA